MAWALPTNVTGLGSLFTYVNTITNQLFAFMMLISLYFIVFFSIKQTYITEKALVIASFITMISAYFFWTLQLITTKIMILFILILAFSLLYLTYVSKKADA